MGWKANCILISEREEGFLATHPVHDSSRAAKIVQQLGYRGYRSNGMTTFDVGMYPTFLTIGAYDGAVVIGLPRPSSNSLETVTVPGCYNASPSVVDYFDPDGSKAKRLLELFPCSKILCLVLESTNNLSGYAYYESAKFLRARALNIDDGVFIDRGELLSEEEALFAASVVREGARVFFDTTGESTEDAIGEEFVFELSKRFFGDRIDEGDCDRLEMESFRQRKWRFW